MAVTLTVAAAAAACRVGSTAAETAEVTRLLSYATEAIQQHLRDEYADAPEAACNEAAVRLIGYLFDQPTASRGDQYANAMRSSGAARMLLPYIVHRLGTTGDAVAAAAQAAGVDVAEVNRLIAEYLAANPIETVAETARDAAGALLMTEQSDRILPDPSGLADGVVAKASGGKWTAGTDETGGGGVLVGIGDQTTVNSAGNEAVFTAATVAALVAAWNAGTYRQFLVTVQDTSGSTHSLWQFSAFRYPNNLADGSNYNLSMAGGTYYADVAFDVNLAITLAGTDTLKITSLPNGSLPSGATTTLWGVP